MKPYGKVSLSVNISRCKLHHANHNKYSITLKFGKNHTLSTQFKSAHENIIDFNSNLHLDIEKNTLDNIHKASLFLNIVAEDKSRKTVGNTFVDFRKQGAQSIVVPECSCKDKGFQVEISCLLVLNDLKFSKVSKQKQQIKIKQSRKNIDVKEEKKKFKQQINQGQKLKRVKSQKMVQSACKQIEIIPRSKQLPSQKDQLIKKQAQLLRQKLNQKNLAEQQLKKQILQMKKDVSSLQQLLMLEQEKYLEAEKHIQFIEQELYIYVPKKKTNLNHTINQNEQIILQNEELQLEITRIKKENYQLKTTIESLRIQFDLERQQFLTKLGEKDFGINIELENQLKKNSTINENLKEKLTKMSQQLHNNLFYLSKVKQDYQNQLTKNILLQKQNKNYKEKLEQNSTKIKSFKTAQCFDKKIQYLNKQKAKKPPMKSPNKKQEQKVKFQSSASQFKQNSSSQSPIQTESFTNKQFYTTEETSN